MILSNLMIKFAVVFLQKHLFVLLHLTILAKVSIYHIRLYDERMYYYKIFKLETKMFNMRIKNILSPFHIPQIESTEFVFSINQNCILRYWRTNLFESMWNVSWLITIKLSMLFNLQCILHLAKIRKVCWVSLNDKPLIPIWQCTTALTDLALWIG